MILIAGSPATVDTSGWQPMARHIYEIKQRSPVRFEYESEHHLWFEMLLRAEIVEAARSLNESGVQFAVFSEARCNEQYWLLTPQGGFRLRPGVMPADAIRDIFRNGPLYAFECATAIPIIYYKAVLEALGDRQFNRLFQNLLLYSWNYDSDLGLIQEHVSPRLSVPGDVLYFDNPDHDPNMPEWQGLNVVVLGEDLFYGHGLGIATGWEIVAGLNRLRRPGSIVSAHLLDLIVYPDFLYLSQFAPAMRAQAAVQEVGSPSSQQLAPFVRSWEQLEAQASHRRTSQVRVRAGRRRYVW